MNGICRDMKFSRHSHETYAFGVVEKGALGFRYRGEDIVAAPGMVNLVIPGEVHDGHPATGQGWIYRMAYVDPQSVRKAAADLWGRNEELPFISRGVLEDPELCLLFRRLHVDLQSGRLDRLAASSLWTIFISNLLKRYGEYHSNERILPSPMGDACAFLEENLSCNTSLEELAGRFSLSPWHFLRSFRKETGLPPHTYLIQLRIQRAQVLLRSGLPPAQVASEVGFADQSHLNRWFRKIVGATPAAFRRDLSCATPPLPDGGSPL